MRKKPGIFRTVLRPLWPRPGRFVLGSLLVWALVALSLAWTAGGWEALPFVPAGSASGAATEVDRLIERAERAGRMWHGVERYYRQEIEPIERVLRRYRDDPVLARRIALALFLEAREVEVEPRLLLAVLLVENPWLDPMARSEVGARGLMQVMPQHEGHWPPCAPDLDDVEANICHGARIFAHYFRLEDGNIERALLRYNGCVRGTNTPNCHTYPYHVYARAGRASILAWLRPPPEGAED